MCILSARPAYLRNATCVRPARFRPARQVTTRPPGPVEGRQTLHTKRLLRFHRVFAKPYKTHRKHTCLSLGSPCLNMPGRQTCVGVRSGDRACRRLAFKLCAVSKSLENISSNVLLAIPGRQMCAGIMLAHSTACQDCAALQKACKRKLTEPFIISGRQMCASVMFARTGLLHTQARHENMKEMLATATFLRCRLRNVIAAMVSAICWAASEAGAITEWPSQRRTTEPPSRRTAQPPRLGTG